MEKTKTDLYLEFMYRMREDVNILKKSFNFMFRNYNIPDDKFEEEYTKSSPYSELRTITKVLINDYIIPLESKYGMPYKTMIKELKTYDMINVKNAIQFLEAKYKLQKSI